MTARPSSYAFLSKVPTYKMGSLVITTFEGCDEGKHNYAKCPALVRAAAAISTQLVLLYEQVKET